MGAEGNLARERCLVEGVGRGDLKIAAGQHTSVGASDAVATGLSTVIAAVASLDDAPGVAAGDAALASASIGNQAGSPASGSILVETWQDDFSAAANFGVKVNWVAVGY